MILAISERDGDTQIVGVCMYYLLCRSMKVHIEIEIVAFNFGPGLYICIICIACMRRIIKSNQAWKQEEKKKEGRRGRSQPPRPSVSALLCTGVSCLDEQCEIVICY